MSENCIDFHFTIQLETEEEKAWIRRLLAALGDQTPAVEDARLVSNNIQFLKEVGVEDVDANNYDFWPNFEYGIEDSNLLRIWSGGDGNPDYVAEAIKAYLNKFCKTGFVVFEVAYTDTGGGPDAYGGAGYTVTADGVEIMGTGNWIREQAAEFIKDGGIDKNGSG